jgi:hypothetical protein
MSTPASNCEGPAKGRDLACGGRGILIWIVPAVILSVTASVGGPYLVVVWPVLLTFMGVACLLNARRCGRRHCFIVGPFFLIIAALSLLYGLGIVPLGPLGWQRLVYVLLIGGCALTCVPEWLFGKYVRPSQSSLRSRPEGPEHQVGDAAATDPAPVSRRR